MNTDTLFWGCFIAVLAIVLLMIFSIPVLITLLIYKLMNERGEIYRKIGFTIFSSTAFLMSILYILGILSLFYDEDSFRPKYDRITINQIIGGKLICSSVYKGNLQDWEYRVEYKYITNNNDTINMGSGYFDTRSWGKNEQLGIYGNWLFLRTADGKYWDRVYLKNIVTDSTISYKINISDKYNFERLKKHIVMGNQYNFTKWKYIFYRKT